LPYCCSNSLDEKTIIVNNLIKRTVPYGKTVNTAENRKNVWKKLDSGGKSCLAKNGLKNGEVTMLLEKIPLNDGYEIRVEFEAGAYRVYGSLDGKPVTTEIIKSVLLALANSVNNSAKDYEQSTAKAIDECGIEECSTLEEAWKAISSKLPDKSVYQDMISVVVALLKSKPNLLFTGPTP